MMINVEEDSSDEDSDFEEYVNQATRAESLVKEVQMLKRYEIYEL